VVNTSWVGGPNGAALSVAAAEIAAAKFESAAFVAVTEQVPLALVIVTLAPEMEQAPLAPNVTAPVPLPPLKPTVKDAPFGCADPGTPVTESVACAASAAFTGAAGDVREA
jgi:hypothetical protein